ncbi:MAG: hypothetical protein JSS70_13830 [Bacteroidetes bacterium]|nr:hypothetical protein [Bacteroidota bacterium]
MIKQIPTFILTLYAFLNVSFGQGSNNQEPVFSTEELKADLKQLRTKLENNHPGLYLYSSKPAIDKVFDSLENSILKPLTELEFYRHITIISSIIKDGHTILLPDEKITNSEGNIVNFLPYHFVILNNQLFIDMVYTGDNSIPAGSEITSINNVAASEIIRLLSERQVRDGNNLTYPLWILSNYFRQYYSFIFGRPANYSINYKISGQPNTASVKALTKDSIYFYRQKNYPGKTFSNLPNEGLKLKIENGNKYAILTIKDFHNDVLKKEYKQNFDKVIAAYFEQINNSKTGNLVLDLRNNQGGDIENGVYLLSYLLDKPFSVVREYNCVNNNEVLHCNGPSLGEHPPKPGNFKGKLYVLINGGSFSNSGIVASCLQANQRATFIGQETGGNPSVISGFIKEIKLSNTKIRVQIPTKQFVITSKANNNGQGIIPTELVIPKLTDILEDRDTELDYTIDLINRTNNGGQRYADGFRQDEHIKKP